MKNVKLNADAKSSVFVIILTVAAYVGEKAFETFGEANKISAILIAMLSTVIVALALFIVSRIQDVYWGLLAALFGYKMLPVPIVFLWSQSMDAHILYFALSKCTMIAFAVLIYRIYRTQEHPRNIKAVPILAAMFAVPFFNGVASEFTSYFFNRTGGDMTFGFFSQYLCYLAAAAIILALGYVSTLDSLKLVAGFEIIAVAVNIIRTAGSIAKGMMNNTHISKSLYLWLAVYAVVFVATVVSVKIKSKKESELIKA